MAGHADGAQEASELNKEVLASIEKLKRAAEKQPIPEAQAGAAKQMPAALKAPIRAFALTVMRQTEKQENTLKLALDAVMPVMEPHTTRPSLSVRSFFQSSAAALPALFSRSASLDPCLSRVCHCIAGCGLCELEESSPTI